MNRRIYQVLLFLVITSLLFSGCSGTIPVNYTAQNFMRYQGNIDIGRFTYIPFMQGRVAPNQIANTAIGNIYIGANIADLVQRATALELEKTGFLIGENSPLQISGDVLMFKAADLGYSIDWTYSVRYRITNKSNNADLFSRVYVAEPKRTGKFGMPADYGPSINEMILSGYDQFIRDREVRNIFSQ